MSTDETDKPGDPVKEFKDGMAAIAAGANPNYEPMLQFFEYKHLPTHLGEISKAFHDLAVKLINDLPRNPERTVMLRKMLEAKDCAVRARLYK
jgi:hypothetical protein